MSQTGPDLITAIRSWIHAATRRRPSSGGRTAGPDHDRFVPVLDAVAADGLAGLRDATDELAAYRDSLCELDPDAFDRNGALAFWLNLYNAEALALALVGMELGHDSLLKMDNAFSTPVTRIAGEELSLDDIEHGKVRRFKDPRIHAALTCASFSCPSLPAEPFRGDDLDARLDSAMREYLEESVVVDLRDCRVSLSRVFKWFGGDFVRPGRMPLILPARKRPIVRSLAPWLPPELSQWIEQAGPAIEFQPYDWSLACRVRAPAQ
jgi:hypothetical protein